MKGWLELRRGHIADLRSDGLFEMSSMGAPSEPLEVELCLEPCRESHRALLGEAGIALPANTVRDPTEEVLCERGNVWVIF